MKLEKTKMTFKKNPFLDISTQVSSSYLTAYMQSLNDIGSVNVKQSGDCSGYSWNIRWNQGGKKSLISVGRLYFCVFF